MSIAPAHADRVDVAVAANFRPTLETLASVFQAQSGHQLAISSGATGMLYAQIRKGAPYALLLAADTLRPALLEREGRGLPGSRVTYARGRLALWVPGAGAEGRRLDESLLPELPRLALSNPRTAPYGEAARDTLTTLGYWEALQPRLVYGSNAAQSLQFVASGGVPAGLVALAQLQQLPASPADYWLVPAHLHQPIDQQALLLAPAGQAPAAQAFWTFLQSETARGLIRAAGYETPEPATDAAPARAAEATP